MLGGDVKRERIDAPLETVRVPLETRSEEWGSEKITGAGVKGARNALMSEEVM